MKYFCKCTCTFLVVDQPFFFINSCYHYFFNSYNILCCYQLVILKPLMYYPTFGVGYTGELIEIMLYEDSVKNFVACTFIQNSKL